MTTSPSSRFPQALDDDDDDVAWALQTALVQWKRGAQPDAIVWLRRAADSADQLGLVWRAADLRRSADELSAELAGVAAPASRPPASRPPTPRPATSRPPTPRPATSRPPTPPPPTPRPTPPLPPPSMASAEIDELLGGGEDDGLETIDVASGQVALDQVVVDPAGPLPSFAPVEESEFEEEVLALGDDDVEVEAEEEAEEEADLVEDTIDEHVPSVLLREAPDSMPGLELPTESSRGPISSEPNTDRDVLAMYSEADDPVTQPHLEDPRLAAPPEPEPEPEPDPRIGDVILGEVHGLEDLPPEGQASLVRQAAIETLNTDDEVSAFGLALVVRGKVSVMPTIADVSCARVGKGEIVWSQGNLEDGVALRLVAIEDATEVATWEASVLNQEVRDLPWIVDDLKVLADRFQALAGVAMGPMGERLDDVMRAMVTERCEVKRMLPGEELVEKGKPVGGMYIIAAGRIEIGDDDAIESELGPGDFLFAAQVLSGGAAPHAARAGKGGALALFAGRHVAHELLLSVPPLLEIF
ncbi:MAG TPA: hypothetical protein VNW92_32045, partial [Polyangiaceae bacterium]|nr:hypothetical protein [Polyangiaceae bacterium]